MAFAHVDFMNKLDSPIDMYRKNISNVLTHFKFKFLKYAKLSKLIYITSGVQSKSYREQKFVYF